MEPATVAVRVELAVLIVAAFIGTAAAKVLELSLLAPAMVYGAYLL